MTADDPQSDSGMVWEDPPPGAMVRWTAAFVAACRENPGKWARVVNPVTGRTIHGSSLHAQLRRAGLELRTSGFEADGSRLPSGSQRMWARWPDA